MNRELPWPDWRIWHLLMPFLYLGITTILGLGLAFAPLKEEAPWRLVPIYGTLGLVGFLTAKVVSEPSRRDVDERPGQRQQA